LKETKAGDDAAGEEGEQHGEVCAVVVHVALSHERHDGRWPDGDVFGAAQKQVHEAAHEAGVQAILQTPKRTVLYISLPRGKVSGSLLLSLEIFKVAFLAFEFDSGSLVILCGLRQISWLDIMG